MRDLQRRRADFAKDAARGALEGCPNIKGLRPFSAPRRPPAFAGAGPCLGATLSSGASGCRTNSAAWQERFDMSKVYFAHGYSASRAGACYTLGLIGPTEALAVCFFNCASRWTMKTLAAKMMAAPIHVHRSMISPNTA